MQKRYWGGLTDPVRSERECPSNHIECALCDASMAYCLSRYPVVTITGLSQIS